MQKHTKTYFDHFGITPGEYIAGGIIGVFILDMVQRGIL